MSIFNPFSWFKRKPPAEPVTAGLPPVELEPEADPLAAFVAGLRADFEARIAELAELEKESATDNLRGKRRAAREEVEGWLADLPPAPEKKL